MNVLDRNMKVFIKIHEMLKKNNRDCLIILSGSTSLALQEVDIEAHDIDIVTDKEGALLLDELLKKYNVDKMEYSSTNTYRSYYGKYIIDEVKVDIIGEFQYRLKDGNWSVENHLHDIHYVKYDNVDVPVLSLQQELVEYENVGKENTVHRIRKKLNNDNKKD